MSDRPEETGEWRALDPRFVPMQRWHLRLLALGGSGACLGALVTVLAAADDLPAWAPALLGAGWLLLAAALATFAEAWPRRQFAHARYRLDPSSLEIARGVIWRTVICVPRTRVQHIDVSQGPLERSHGLGTLVVYTAGTTHARVALPGLAYGDALALRDQLRRDRDDDSV